MDAKKQRILMEDALSLSILDDGVYASSFFTWS